MGFRTGWGKFFSGATGPTSQRVSFAEGDGAAVSEFFRWLAAFGKVFGATHKNSALSPKEFDRCGLHMPARLPTVPSEGSKCLEMSLW
jgi:hypothetical protein